MPTASCDQCHRKRLQCAGGKPTCDRCIKTSQTCTYSTGRPVGKPKGHRKNKTNESIEFTPESRMHDHLSQNKLDWTTSDSSPSFSDVNEAEGSFAMKAQARTATTRFSTSTTTSSMLASTAFAALNPASNEFVWPGTFNTLAAFTPEVQNQLADTEVINTTSVSSTFSVPSDNSLPPGVQHFAWQPIVGHSIATTSTQSDMQPQHFFDPSTLMGPQGTLHDQAIYPSDVMVTDGSFIPPGFFNLPQNQAQPSSGQTDCPELSAISAVLFRSHFQGQDSNFDMTLNLVHKCIEAARKSCQFGECSSPDPSRSTVMLLFLQQAVLSCQKLLSLATIDTDEQGVQPSGQTTHNKFNSANLAPSMMRDLQASVKISVAAAEVAKLRQLTDDFKTSIAQQSYHMGHHPSFWPLVEALDEVLTTMQQEFPCLKF